MSTESSTPVRVYLARVRNALDDLPPAELEEILDDVRPHMAEIAAELSPGARVDALIEQLGTPEAYAAELRAAGEYPPRTESTTLASSKHKAAPRLALWVLVACALLIGVFALAAARTMDAPFLLAAVVPLVPLLLSAWYIASRGTANVAGLPEVKRLRSFLSRDNRMFGYLRSLSPAWPLVCGLVFVGLGLSLFLRRGPSGLVTLLVLTALTAAVVATAARVKVDRRWLWLHLPVAAVVVGSGLGMAVYFAEMVGPGYGNNVSYSPATTVDGSPALTYGGDPVGNVYAFDSQGKPLTDVYLFDSNGRPISLPRYTCDPASGISTRAGEDNRFPHPNAGPSVGDPYSSVYGGPYSGGRYGGAPACHDQPGVPFAAAIPTPTPTSSASPTPSAGSSPSPTATPPATTTPKPTTSIKPPG
jgi:uncharacterized membrane protein